MAKRIKKKLRNEMQCGKSISDVCTEYNLTFKDLVGIMMSGERITSKKAYHSREKHITKIGEKKWIIRHDTHHYGTYKRLGDAKRVRDYFVEFGWDKDCIDKACESVGVKRVKKGRY